ncbi:hypothetical protein GCM10010401_06100 [Rarobacter faecitabidus]|uniref:O-glycosyl hydrolase n=1 Tax=Rarobacter faecitabidus TaxID=13243 RepID=A0A542ZTF0_RARFA|nr:ricin-type beta-trefoil lectin domain protein [Rarobacter faecitabidus]TQL63638.1 O-glycosyl hydrolase [Rarobacter faecitabidus]
MRTRSRRSRSLANLGISVGLTLVLPLGFVAPATTPAAAADGSVSVWLTEADNSSGARLAKQADLTWGSNSGGVEISINASQTYQSIVGFGASFTDSSSYVVNKLSESKKTEWFNDMFTKSSSSSAGIGLTWLRQPLGASDYIAPAIRSTVPATGNVFYTYQDNQAGNVDISADNPSIANVVRAKQINPSIVVVGTPWSAPGWMRENNSILGNVGGSLKSDKEATYASYLAEVAQQYKDRGANLDYITIQNEPQFAPSYPGMIMDAAQQARVANSLAPQLASKGLNTKILGWDHNWDVPSYPTTVLQQAGSSVAGTAWHCYAVNKPGVGGYDSGRPIIDASKQSEVRNNFTNKDTFLTECSSTESANRDNTFKDSIWYHMSVVAIPSLRNWSRSLSYWNLALDSNNGPYPSGYNICDTCTALTTIDSNSAYKRGAPYYFLGHFSKFVQQGAVRVGSSEESSAVQNVAFKNPDGTYAVVVHNGGGPQDVRISFDGKSIKRQLAANTIATFTWGTPSPVEPADPEVSESDGPIGAIVGLGSAKCLDLRSGSETKDNGTAIQQYDCNGTPKGQRWQYRAGTDKTLRIRGKCLTTAADSVGAKAALYDCTASRTKAWTVSGERITSPAGLCLTVPGNSTANAVEVELATCSDAAGQRWLVPSTTVTGNATIYATQAPTRCVGTTNGTALGAPVRSIPCAGASAILRAGDGSLRLGGKCVAYRAADSSQSAANGSKLFLAYCTGQNEQKWDVNQDGTIALRSAAQCLDLTDGDTTSTVQLQTWECSPGNDNQRWGTTVVSGGGTDPGTGGGDQEPGTGDGDPGGTNPGTGGTNGTNSSIQAEKTTETATGTTTWATSTIKIVASGLATRVGKAGRVRVLITQANSAAGGRVTLDFAGRKASASLHQGAAEFRLPRANRGGQQPLKLTYLPATGTTITTIGTVNVRKATAKISSVKISKGRFHKGIRTRGAARISVRVTAPSGVAVTGKVTLKVGKRKLATGKVRQVAGRYIATVKIKAKSKRTAGRITATYSGDANVNSTTRKTGLKVIR